jgi:hypothetical protein
MQFAMEKENSNPPMDHQSKEEAVIRDAMAPAVVEAVVGTLRTPKFVDGSKQEAVVRDAASTSADTVETSTQNAMIFWDEVDDDDYWVQQEDLDAPLDVAQVVNPWLDFLMATVAPETAALLRTIHANTNIFNVGTHVNANNQFAAQTRTEASATARPSAPVNSTIFAGSTEEEDGNEWYKSIARDAQRLEQMEEPEIQEMPSPLRLPEAPPKEEHCGQKRPSAGEDGRELTLEDYCKIWGLHPSELDPDEPAPSTKRQSRVLPLADDEVAKFDCGICLETLPILDLFHGMQCDHKFCAQCMATYIEGRIRDGGVSILCPDPACKEAAGEGSNNGGVLNPEHCKKSIDFAAFCIWGDRLTEKAIPQDQRVYCPNPRCGLMLERTFGANKAPCKAPCPACNHPMCTTCGLGWVIDGRDDDHHNCDEGKGAALVKELAAQRRWKQCPSCKMVVERIMGCDTMHCRYIYWTLLAFYLLSQFLLVFNPHSDLLYSITNS